MNGCGIPLVAVAFADKLVAPAIVAVLKGLFLSGFRVDTVNDRSPCLDLGKYKTGLRPAGRRICRDHKIRPRRAFFQLQYFGFRAVNLER